MMLGLALASLAPTSEAVPVAVEFEDADALLRGVVTQRLLEGGRVLAPAGSPTVVRLSVRRLRHSVLVEGTWGRNRVFREIDHGDAELTLLEVAHGTVDVLERLEVDEPEGSDVAERVALEFVGFSPDPRLYAEVTQALLGAGFVVTGRERGSDWSLCVWRDAGGTYAVDRADAPPCPSRPPVQGPGSLGDRVDQIARASAEATTNGLAEQVSAQAQDHEEVEPPSMAPTRESARRELQPLREPPPAWLEVHVDAGPQLRWPAVDGGSHLSLGAGAGRFGAGARVEFLPSISSLRVLDTVLLGGPSVGWSIGARVRMRLHALAGVLLHRAVAVGEEVARRTDFSALLQLVTDFPLRKGWGLHVGLSAGVSSRARRHVSIETGEVLWARSPWRAGLVAGFHYRHTWRRHTWRRHTWRRHPGRGRER